MTVALVIGGARDTWPEVERAFREFSVDRIVAINQAVADYVGYIDAAVSLHPVKLQGWLDSRSRARATGAFSIGHIVSFKDHDGLIKYPVTDVVPYLWWGMTKSGSSGLYAVKVAMKLLGANKIILAGVPMDAGPHYYNGRPWGVPMDFREGWEQAMPYIKDTVRSYSGWTKELLGEPTQEWISA